MKKVVIVGGSDGFGKWLAGYIIEIFKNDILLTITGRNEEKLKTVAQKINCNYTTDNLSVIPEADITVFSVPIAYTEKLISQYAPYLKIGSMVLDVTSIKKRPSQAFYNSVPDGVLVVPTHPMFGPFISTIAGQIFVLTPKDKDKSDIRYKFLLNFLKEKGATVVESNPVEHDKMMAIVQGLTHFNMFVLAETIKRLGVDIEKSFNFVSPIYKIMISSVGRYMNQNPKLYGDIQMFNNEVLDVHKVFMEVSYDFNKYVKEKDEDNFIEAINGSKEYFGKNASSGQKYIDKIIYMLSKQIELAEENIGNNIILKNIYNNEVIKAKLISYKDRNLFLDNDKKYLIDEWEIIIT